jgi:metallophosphoesterase (TIGR00282 family)
MIKILFLGDIVGKAGRSVVASQLPELRSQYEPDVVIANGENSAGGLGIDRGCADEIFKAGVDLITLGNHTWKKKEVGDLLARDAARMVRPANYAPGAPGRGILRWESPQGWSLRLINLIGRVFIPDLLDCPFQAAAALLDDPSYHADITLVDFHAEATSEKAAMGYFLDGRVQIVLGTHTHVQTADEQLLPNGTAYITDVGMCGPAQGVIGVDAKLIVEKFVSGLPNKFELASGKSMLNGVLFELDRENFAVQRISRIQVRP